MSSAFKRSALLGLSASAVLATGCANMTTTATSVTSNGVATMSGHIFGGNQPVTASDVRLYAAGTGGYGQPGTLYATTTTDDSGDFSFSQVANAGSGQTGTKVYSCPSSGDPQLYIVARGGNTQGTGNGANNAAVFMVAVGPCSTAANAVVDMTETSTVATLAALQQYFAPSSTTSTGLNQLAYPNTTQAAAGFANAVALIPNLVNLQTGIVAQTTLSATPAGSTSAISVTVTPEINKINTLANILAACVNTTSATSTNCTTLFQNATPPSSAQTSQPTRSLKTANDTLSALYYMLTNPTSGSATNLNNLYALQAGAGAPFLPDEAAAPTDWTVGLSYGSPTAASNACSNGGSSFLLDVYHISIDASGNAWAVSGAGAGNLFEIGPNGTPLACLLGSTLGVSNTVAVGPNNNVWTGGIAGNNIYEIPAATPGSTPTVWPTGEANFVQNLVLDVAGNLEFTPYSGGTDMYQFVGAASASAPTTSVLISSGLATQPDYLGADTQGAIYATDSLSTSSSVFDIYPNTGAGNTGGYMTANIATTSSANYSVGVAAGNASTVAVLNGSTSSSPTIANSITSFTPSSTGTATSTTTTPQIGGISSGSEVAVDGAGNLWTASLTQTAGSYTNGSTTSTLYMLNELTTSGTPISPSGTGTASDTVNGGFQKDTMVLPNAPRGVAIDLSGNVWTGSGSSTGTNIMVLVGQAVPVITPIPSSLAAGASSGNAGQKP